MWSHSLSTRSHSQGNWVSIILFYLLKVLVIFGSLLFYWLLCSRYFMVGELGNRLSWLKAKLRQSFKEICPVSLSDQEFRVENRTLLHTRLVTELVNLLRMLLLLLFPVFCPPGEPRGLCMHLPNWLQFCFQHHPSARRKIMWNVGLQCSNFTTALGKLKYKIFFMHAAPVAAIRQGTVGH